MNAGEHNLVETLEPDHLASGIENIKAAQTNFFAEVVDWAHSSTPSLDTFPLCTPASAAAARAVCEVAGIVLHDEDIPDDRRGDVLAGILHGAIEDRKMVFNHIRGPQSTNSEDSIFANDRDEVRESFMGDDFKAHQCLNNDYIARGVVPKTLTKIVAERYAGDLCSNSMELLRTYGIVVTQPELQAKFERHLRRGHTNLEGVREVVKTHKRAAAVAAALTTGAAGLLLKRAGTRR